MTKILLCPSAFYPSLGGVEEICRNFGNELLRRNFEVKVAVNRHPASLPEHELLENLDVHRFEFSYPNKSVGGLQKALRMPQDAKRFLTFVENYKPDIMHVICPSSSSLYAHLAKRLIKLPLVVTLQGEFFMDADQIYQRSWFARTCASKLLSSADAITACSQYVMDDASRRFTFSAKHQLVIFNGVDTEENSTAGAPLPQKDYILGVGRLVQNKGFDWLLRAFKKLAIENDSVDLIIAGAGPAADDLSALTTELQLNDRVHFVGRKNRADVTELFQNCLFFVMPSPVEPFGIVCLEAMRAGKPVIAANSGGPKEFINGCGMLVEPLDDEGLHQALKRLCEDPSFRNQLCEESKKQIGKFSWKTITNDYIEIYESCSKLS